MKVYASSSRLSTSEFPDACKLKVVRSSLWETRRRVKERHVSYKLLTATRHIIAVTVINVQNISLYTC